MKTVLSAISIKVKIRLYFIIFMAFLGIVLESLSIVSVFPLIKILVDPEYFNTKFFADSNKNIIGILYKQSNSTQGIKNDSLEIHDNFINKKFRELVFNTF